MTTKQEPGPTRPKTRSTNAHAHPGKAAMEVLAVRRKREDIDAEKKAREERRQTRQRKKANEQVAVMDIADFEDRMALDDMNKEIKFPRHQTEGKYSGPTSACAIIIVHEPLVNDSNESKIENKKRKGRKVQVSNEKNPAKEHQGETVEPELLSDNDRPQVKKQKTARHPIPLRRTGQLCLNFPKRNLTCSIETYIQEIDDSNGRSAVEFPSALDNTPRPIRRKESVIETSDSEDGDSQVETEEEDFTTPKALQKKGRTFPSGNESDVQVVEIASESGLEYESSNQGGKYMLDNLSKYGRSDSADDNEEESDLQEVKTTKTRARKTLKTIDLTKVTQARKDKRAFRKEVEGKREVVAKGKGSNQKVRFALD